MLTFEQPWLLLLLIPVGLLLYLTWRNMALPFPNKQRIMILGVRLALFTLIIAALAGAAWRLPASKHTTVFVGDISDSTVTQRSFIEKWIGDALKYKRENDQVGIVAVGRNALVEQAVRESIDFAHFESTPDTNYTDLAAGLRLAAAIMPSDSERHIILFSDGHQNLGDAMQEAQLLQQQGIRLDILALPDIRTAEARIDGLTAPTQLRVNERFLLHAKITSTVEQKAKLRLYLDQNLLKEQDVTLVAGEQEINFSLLAPPPGFHTFQLTLDAPQDTIPLNNKASAFVNVQGPPTVLLVEGQPGSGKNILNALKATQINVKVVSPNDVPTTLDGLAPYSSVILADVPAVTLGLARMQVLQAFVRDLGHGLVVSGGQNSYGPGSYAATPLEETLPVRMDIPQHKDTPDLAVVLIVESLETQLPINISKEAAKGVVNLLTERDQVAISSGYGTLTVPMQHVTDKAKINKAITDMNPNDPPSYNPDFVTAEQALLKTNAKIKHVIMLGDGDAFDNYIPQISKMAKEGITVSTVATNSMSAGELGIMQSIAQAGNGRFYQADDPGTIPQILLKETERAARRSLINETFTPAILASHPILGGIKDFPQLEGYVATTPKTSAQMVMVSHLDDPVLAVWQYGLGRVAAWTSDALGLWTKNWLQWQEAARWWANVVTWTLATPESAMNVNGKIVNGTGQLAVDLPAGTSTNNKGEQQMQVHIIYPDNAQYELNMSPKGADHWEGNFPAQQVGAYLLQIKWTGSSGNTLNTMSATSGMVVPYSPEYQTEGTDTRFLTLLAQTGKGKLLSVNTPQEAFSLDLIPVTQGVPIVFWLLMLAALLLPVDVALRRLSGVEFLTLIWQWLLGRFKRGYVRLTSENVAQASEVPVVSSLGNIRQIRREQKARQQVRKSPQTTPSAPEAGQQKRLEAKAESAQPAESITTALLKAKRQRGGK